MRETRILPRRKGYLLLCVLGCLFVFFVKTEKEHSMIISMLKNKISMEQIISITGLTMEKITSIGKQAAVL